MKRSSLAFVIVALVTAWSASAGAAPIYHLTDLGVLPGRAFSYAGGINNSGQVAGYSGVTGTNDAHAFLYSNGTMKDLGTLGGAFSLAGAINSLGQVVGSAATFGNAAQHAFLYSNGTMKDLGAIGGSFSSASSINDSGQIVGVTGLSNNGSLTHPFIYSNGSMSLVPNSFQGEHAYGINNAGTVAGDGMGGAIVWSNGGRMLIDPANALSGQAFAINNNGDVTGHIQYGLYDHDDAFLYKNGTVNDLGSLLTGNGVHGDGGSINVHDQIIGGISNTSTPPYETLFFLYTDGTMYNLSNLLDSSGKGWIINSLGGINDNGWISGGGISPTGLQHAFILKPVPEPSSLLLIAIGGLTAAQTKLRRSKSQKWKNRRPPRAINQGYCSSRNWRILINSHPTGGLEHGDFSKKATSSG